MGKEYPTNFKEEICKRVLNGESISSLSRELNIHRNTISRWVALYKDKTNELEAAQKQTEDESEEIKKIRQEIKILEEENKKLWEEVSPVLNLSESERFEIIYNNKDKGRIARMVQLLDVSESGYYVWYHRNKD